MISIVFKNKYDYIVINLNLNKNYDYIVIMLMIKKSLFKGLNLYLLPE